MWKVVEGCRTVKMGFRDVLMFSEALPLRYQCKPGGEKTKVMSLKVPTKVMTLKFPPKVLNLYQ